MTLAVAWALSPNKLGLNYLSIFQGWDEGVVGMKKKSKRLLIVPAHLAYGPQGMGNKVPPNATLVFDIEVVRVSSSLCSTSRCKITSFASQIATQLKGFATHMGKLFTLCLY